MRFSIFTPTHNPAHLIRAARSIEAQTVDAANVEWVIVCNGQASKGEVKALLKDSKINLRIMQAPETISGVGALKRWACGSANGSILVELDHDDELLPVCLEAIDLAVKAGADFVSSATIEIKADGSDVIYGESFGWEHSDYQLRGVDRRFNKPFPINARTLAEIFYAPNHVRAWTKEAYWKVGGHDASLQICDDQDLMIRTYLSGAEFKVIDTPLYVQHMHKSNTQTEQNSDIQNKCLELKNTHIRALVDEWCKRERLPKYDLGGAHSCPDGWTAVDKFGGDGVVQIDVTHGLPWPDNSVGAIRAHDFLEHIPIGQVVPLMNEIHRVLVPNGWLLTSTPSTDGRGAFQDPTHKSFWNQNSWWYYTRAQQAKYVPEIKARFQGARIFTAYPSEWHKDNDISYVVADLVALKGQRTAGWNGFFEPKQT